MRCPKCHYLSFEPEPRCRNCGYGLSLEEHDLLMREPEAPEGAFADLNLRETAPPAGPAGHSAEPRIADPLAQAPGAGPVSLVGPPPEIVPVLANRPAQSSSRPAPTTELPLFVKGMSPEIARDADAPLITLPAQPRAPLAVQRKVVEPSPAKARSASGSPARKLGPLDRDLLADLQRIEKLEKTEAAAEVRAARRRERPEACVGAMKRLAAAALDASLLGGLSVAVLWVTVRWCDLPLERAATMPVLLPTGAFLALVAIGYLVLFTAAGGQTMGKMALGIRVIGDAASDGDGALTIGQALYRACLTFPSILALGAGFVPALVGDERAVHDRLAHTRVVRA